MSDTLQVRGMVLSSMPIGENDKRIVILTREFGRISAFARGARRPGSLLMAASEPPVFGTFTLIQGRNSYSLIQAQVEQYFRELTQEPEGIYYGYYFLEFADYYGREGLEAASTLNLLYLSLKALLHKQLDNRLVRRIYEFRLMSINGDFAVQPEGLSEGAVYTLQYILGSPLEKLFTFAVTPTILQELEKLAERHMERVLDRPLKSRKILEEVSGSGLQNPCGVLCSDDTGR